MCVVKAMRFPVPLVLYRSKVEAHSTKLSAPNRLKIFHPVLARHSRKISRFQTYALLFPCYYDKWRWLRCSSIAYFRFFPWKPIFHVSSFWHSWESLSSAELCHWKPSPPSITIWNIREWCLRQRRFRSQNTGQFLDDVSSVRTEPIWIFVIADDLL